MLSQVPADAMVLSQEDTGPARFVIKQDLTVEMSNGHGITLAIRLSPVEVRRFAEIFNLLADDVEAMGDDYLAIVACEGSA